MTLSAGYKHLGIKMSFNSAATSLETPVRSMVSLTVDKISSNSAATSLEIVLEKLLPALTFLRPSSRPVSKASAQAVFAGFALRYTGAF